MGNVHNILLGKLENLPRTVDLSGVVPTLLSCSAWSCIRAVCVSRTGVNFNLTMCKDVGTGGYLQPVCSSVETRQTGRVNQAEVRTRQMVFSALRDALASSSAGGSGSVTTKYHKPPLHVRTPAPCQGW
jgi:hypothetical protein